MRHQWPSFLLWAVFALFLGQGLCHPRDAAGELRVRGGGQSTQKPPADIELPGDPPSFVFRGDDRTPEAIKGAKGFSAKGHGMDLSGEELERASSLYLHIDGTNSKITRYVSTTTSPKVAFEFPSTDVKRYMYKISADSKMVDGPKTLGKWIRSGYEAQKEQSVVEGIPWEQVMGWYDVSKLDAKKVEQLERGEKLEEGLFELNKDFDPKYEPLHGSGAVPKLSGFRSNSPAWEEQPWKAFKGQKVSKLFDEFVQSVAPGTGAAPEGEQAEGGQDSPKEEASGPKDEGAEAGPSTSTDGESKPRPESSRRDFKSPCSGNSIKREIRCTKVEEGKLSEAKDLKAKFQESGDKGLIEYENKHLLAANVKELAKDDIKVLKKLLPAKAQLFTMGLVLALDKDSPPFWKALVDGLENKEFTVGDCQIGFKKALSKTIDKRYTEFDSAEHALTTLINIGTDLWDTVEIKTPVNFWIDLVQELPTECREVHAAATPEEKLRVSNEGVDTLIQAWSNLTPVGRANDRWAEDSVKHPEMTTGQKIVDVIYDTFTHFSLLGWVVSKAFPDLAKTVANAPIKRIGQ